MGPTADSGGRSKTPSRRVLLHETGAGILGAQGQMSKPEPLEERGLAVKDWQTPTRLRELKSIIRLASHYRRFVCDFSCIDKGSDFAWTPHYEQAFNSLKKALTESRILTPPSRNMPFILDTNASDLGMGDVLSQTGPEGEKVVAYLNRTFNKAEDATV